MSVYVLVLYRVTPFQFQELFYLFYLYRYPSHNKLSCFFAARDSIGKLLLQSFCYVRNGHFLKYIIIRETLEKYSEEMREEAISIMSFVTLALGLQDTKISESFSEGLYDIRMNCYPPCPEPERVLGIIPHADNSGITLLVDFGDFPGLQFLKDGKWVGVQPIEGAIVANIGHIIEVCIF